MKRVLDVAIEEVVNKMVCAREIRAVAAGVGEVEAGDFLVDDLDQFFGLIKVVVVDLEVEAFR